MHILGSVVNDRKPKMLTGFSCSGHGGSPLFRHGRTALPAHREHLLYRVTSTEQGKTLWESVQSLLRDAQGGAPRGNVCRPRLPRSMANRSTVRLFTLIDRAQSNSPHSLRCRDGRNLDKRIIAISGQSVPILKCVKYCRCEADQAISSPARYSAIGRECQPHLRPLQRTMDSR